MSKLKLKNFFRGKNKNNSLTEHIFFNLKNHPTYHSEARLVNLFTVRARWCFAGVSIFLVFALSVGSGSWRTERASQLAAWTIPVTKQRSWRPWWELQSKDDKKTDNLLSNAHVFSSNMDVWDGENRPEPRSFIVSCEDVHTVYKKTSSWKYAHTKRPKTKHPKTKRPRDKTP